MTKAAAARGVAALLVFAAVSLGLGLWFPRTRRGLAPALDQPAA